MARIDRRISFRTRRVLRSPAALLAGVLAVAVAAVPFALSQASSTPVRTASVRAAEDTSISMERPRALAGTAPLLTASNRGRQHSLTLLRFRVSVPPGHVVSRAVLVTASDRVPVGRVDVRVADRRWSEGSTSWRNRPVVSRVVSSAAPRPGSRTLAFDVTRLVRRSATYSLALTAGSAAGSHRFYSRETGAGPRLLLTFRAPVPTARPTSPPLASASPAATSTLPGDAPTGLARPTVPTSEPGTPPAPTDLPPAPTDPVVVDPTPTPVPTPSSDPWPAQPGGATQFGLNVQRTSGESYPQALARVRASFGSMPVSRVFYPGLPAPWPGEAGMSGRNVVVSFKAAPADVVAGRVDATFRSWFAAAPRDRQVYWSYWHEPEDDVEDATIDAPTYRAAWAHLSALARESGSPNLHATLILMCWTLESGSGRTWTDYYAGASSVDVLGWDCYNGGAKNGTYRPVAALYRDAVAVSAAAGKPFGIAETGSRLVAGDDGSRRAAWLTEAGAYLRSTGAMWVTAFSAQMPGGDYRLGDAPSTAAWRALVTSSR